MRALLVELHSDNERIPSAPISASGRLPQAFPLRYRIGGHVGDRSFNHRGQALVERRQSNHGGEPFLDVDHFLRIEARFDEQSIADGQELENDGAGRNDATLRVVQKPDDDAGHRRPDLDAIHDVARGADLLSDIVELGLRGAQIFQRLLE